MEYLMTYGWAILIIAIVMAALFSLGGFSKASLSPTACIAVSGYECTGASLIGNTLTATLEQFTGTSWSGVSFYLYNSSITPTSCPTGPSAGVFLGSNSSISLPSDTASVQAFTVATNPLALGTAYSGTIWAVYTPAGSSTSQCAQIAAVSIKVT